MSRQEIPFHDVIPPALDQHGIDEFLAPVEAPMKAPTFMLLLNSASIYTLCRNLLLHNLDAIPNSPDSSATETDTFDQIASTCFKLMYLTRILREQLLREVELGYLTETLTDRLCFDEFQLTVDDHCHDIDPHIDSVENSWGPEVTGGHYHKVATFLSDIIRRHSKSSSRDEQLTNSVKGEAQRFQEMSDFAGMFVISGRFVEDPHAYSTHLDEMYEAFREGNVRDFPHLARLNEVEFKNLARQVVAQQYLLSHCSLKLSQLKVIAAAAAAQAGSKTSSGDPL